MIKRLIPYLCVFVNIIVSGCSEHPLPHSVGKRDDIIMIAPDEIGTDSLKKLLERVEFCPSREEVYFVREYSPFSLKQYKYWRNIIIIGWLGNEYIDNLLTEESRKAISQEGGLFAEKDLWVRLQSVVIIVGKDREETQRLVDKFGDAAYYIFRERERERFERVLYMDGIRKREIEKMGNILGATFDIPPGYYISIEKEYLMTFIRKSPDRLVTLYYNLTPIHNPIRFRDSLFTVEFEGDSVYIPLTSIDTVMFNNSTAIKIQGVWQNQSKVMGGPFVSYIFKKDGIWYFLDGHVFAPGKKKWFYLEEVDIILHTFKKGF